MKYLEFYKIGSNEVPESPLLLTSMAEVNSYFEDQDQVKSALQLGETVIFSKEEFSEKVSEFNYSSRSKKYLKESLDSNPFK